MIKRIIKISLIVILAVVVLILFNMPNAYATTQTVSNLTELQDALLSNTVDEIIVTQAITVPDNTELNGNNKIVRVETPCVDSNGQLAETPSENRIFIIENSTEVTIENMIIMGGMTSGYAAISNYGNLTLENVSVVRSNRAVENDGGQLIAKNCNFAFNVARSAGAIWNGNGAKLILDGCSLSNNRSNGGSSSGGGAIGVSGSNSYLYANNTVFAYNSTEEIGGAINVYNGNVYLMNCTITGNCTERSNAYGGGIGKNGGHLYIVNSLLVDNYANSKTTPTRSDLGIYSSGSNNAELYNCVYSNIDGTSFTATACKTDSECHTIAGYTTDGILTADGTMSSNFFKPSVVWGDNQYFVYARVKVNGEAATGGINTYLDYSDLDNIKMGYGPQDSIVSLGGLAIPESSKKIDIFIEGLSRNDGIIGASYCAINNWGELQQAINLGGTIVLTHGFEAGSGDSNLTITNPVVLDLNGNIINRKSGGTVLEVYSNLTIIDSDPINTHYSSVFYNNPVTGEKVFVNGGVITGGSNAGIICYSNSIVTLNGGRIVCNTTTNHGGGVVLRDGAKFYMNGGSIIGNTAPSGNGGAVWVYDGNAEFHLNGGSIMHNSCSGNGGAFYLYNNQSHRSKLYLNGGIISENKSNNPGGGVYVDSNGGQLYISGNPKVYGNRRIYQERLIENNLNASFDAFVNVVGTLTSEAHIGITTPSVPNNDYSSITFTNNYGTYHNDSPSNYFFNDRALERITLNDNEACLSLIPSAKGNSITRTNASTATIKFYSNVSGTYYYVVTNNNVVPTISEIKGANTGIYANGSVTVGTNTINLTGLNTGEQFVHILVNKNGMDSSILTISMPYDIYYYDDFEVYELNSDISSGTLAPMSQIHNGSGNGDQKVITNNAEGKILQLSSSKSYMWASDQIIKWDDMIPSEGKFVLEGDIKPHCSTGETDDWQLSFFLFNGTYSGGHEAGICVKEGKIKDISETYVLKDLVSKEEWYHIKLELISNKYNIYINNQKVANNLTVPSGIDRIAISSGHYHDAYFDNLKYYVDSSFIPMGSIEVPTLGSLHEGYSEAPYNAVNVTISNDYVLDGSKLYFELTGDNPEAFSTVINAENLNGPGLWSNANTFGVGFANGLQPEVYSAVLTLKYDIDGDGTAETTIGSTNISNSILSHNFRVPTYEWNEDNSKVTATRGCYECEITETETVNTTSVVLKAATYDETGMVRFTAEFINPNFVTQTKEVITDRLVKYYDLWVGSTQVTNINKDDILNDGGKVQFYSGTNTLYFDDVTINDYYDYSGVGKCSILSIDMDLTITGKVNLPNENVHSSIAILNDETAYVNGTLNADISVAQEIWVCGNCTVAGGTITKETETLAMYVNKVLTIKSTVKKIDVRTKIVGSKGIAIEDPIAITYPEDAVISDSGSLTGKSNCDNYRIIIEQKNYTVSFVSNGGPLVESQVVPSGGKVQRPMLDMSREEYDYTGWYEEETIETLYDFDKEVRNDFTLYAGYYKDIYTDTTTDDSKAQIKGLVQLYDTYTETENTITVYENEIDVGINDNITDTVLECINSAKSSADAYIAKKGYTNNGFENNMDEITSWNNSSENVLDATYDATHKAIIKKHITSGSYGRITAYITTIYAQYNSHYVFPDVVADKWYSSGIEYCRDNGIMGGYTSGTNAGRFGLNDTITRGQIATMLYRLAGEPDVAGLNNPFTDVPEGKYYTEAVKWAFSKGITTGKTATSFDPNGNVTRQELAVFMARYAKEIGGLDTTSTYDITGIADYSDLSSWAMKPMQYILEKGVITGDMKLGYPRILPRNNATRAEAATMFMRFCQNVLGM